MAGADAVATAATAVAEEDTVQDLRPAEKERGWSK